MGKWLVDKIRRQYEIQVLVWIGDLCFLRNSKLVKEYNNKHFLEVGAFSLACHLVAFWQFQSIIAVNLV